MKIADTLGQTFSTKYGNAEVIEILGNGRVKIKFNNTGFIRDVEMGNLRAGKARDESVKRASKPPLDLILNQKVISNSSGEFIILSRFGKDCDVVFTETGTRKTVLYANAIKGKVDDEFYKSRYGVGHLGVCSHLEEHYKPLHLLWSNMMKRCYSENDKRGYFGKGVSVSDEWKCFATFFKEVKELKYFDKWLNGYNGGEKYNLDKDYKVDGNKVYGKEFCMFLPESLNKSMGAKNKYKSKGLYARE